MAFNIAKRYLMFILFVLYLILSVYLVNYFKVHNSYTPLMVNNVEILPPALPVLIDTAPANSNIDYFKQLNVVRSRITLILDSISALNTTDKVSKYFSKKENFFGGIENLSSQARTEFIKCSPGSQLQYPQGYLEVVRPGLCLYPCGQHQYKESISNLTLHFGCSNFTDMRFLKVNKSRPTVALASFPGSGATWLRYLLEQVSGVFTGSTHCDTSLKRVGYLGEGIHTNDVSVVRVGEIPQNGSICSKCFQFDKVIIVLRNPYPAILSEYNRMTTHSHVEKLPLEHYWDNFTTWNHTVYHLIDMWKHSTEAWLGDADVEIKCVVEYDSLKKDTFSVLTRVMKFIDLPYLPEKMECAAGPLFSPFRLQSVDRYLSKANPYTRAHSLYMNSVIRGLSPLLEKYNIPYYNWLRFH